MSPEGVVLFGDESGRFVVTLLGLGDLRVSWKSTGGVSSLTRKLVVGSNHHVASTWQDGEQRYYIDGQIVLVDDRQGTMAIQDGEPTATIQLGTDQAGVDVTLGEPTVWVGHVLSAQEVSDLAGREVRVGEVAPGSIALRWSLAGPDGESARIGDIGLADSSSGKHDLTSIEGTAPAYRGSVLAAAASAHVGSVQVAPSGTSIVVSLLDATGAFAPVQSLPTTNDMQVISVTGTPAGPSATLNLGGQTTSALPYVLGPPATSLRFSCPITPGTYDIQAFWPEDQMGNATPNGPYSAHATYQIFDTTTLLGTAVCNQQTFPAGFTDPYPSNTTNKTGRFPNPFQPLGTFTFTGTQLVVYLSAPADGKLLAGGTVRVQPHGSTDGSLVFYLSDLDEIAPGVEGAQAQQYGSWSLRFDPGGDNEDPSGAWFQTTPTGTTNSVAISATAIQSALSALSNVPPNSLTVSAVSNSSVKILFGGALGSSAVPTIVSSDPAMTVYHDGTNGSFVGGQTPSISINGGSAVPLKYPVWGASGGYQSYIVYPIPQPSPTSQALSAGVGMFTRTNIYSGHWNFAYGQGYTGANGFGVFKNSGPPSSDTATYPFQGLSPGTYRLSATWTAAVGNCPGALFTVQDGSGNTLGTATFDQTTTPADFNTGGTGWKTIGTFTTTTLTSTFNVLVSFGTQTGTLVIDTVRVDMTSSATPLLVIQPTDVVTFSAPAGFAITTAGSVPAQSAIAVSNKSGGTLLPPVASTATMRVGYNVEGDTNGTLLPIYANFAHRNNWAANYLNVNSDGYPVSGTYPNTACLISGPPSDAQGYGRGLPNAEFGNYTVMWDGPATNNVALIPSATTTVTEVTGSASITGTTNNKRVFTVADPYSFAPSLLLQATTSVQNPDQTLAYSFTNLRVYPPGVNPANPPLFHPATLSKIQGFHCLRFLDPLGTNGSGVVEYSDFGSATNLIYGGANRSATATILSIGPDNSTKFYDPNRASMLFTTTAPHGFPDGAQVVLNGTIGTVNFANGGTGSLNGGGGLIHVLSPTTFIFPYYRGDGASATITNTLTPSGATVSTSFNGTYYSGTIFFPDCIALCNQAGADMWVNVPLLASDACVTAMATAIATGLNAGLKVHVEYSNECWNPQFPQWLFCYSKSHLLGYNDHTYYYVNQAVHIHNLFRSAFAAAGRAVTDVRRVLGTQGSAVSVTTSIANQVKAAGATFDELASAPYFGNDNTQGPEQSLDYIYDCLTVGQILDLMEMNVQFGGLEQEVVLNATTLQAAGINSVQLVTYEGGIGNIIPAPSSADANQAYRTHAAIRHPRMYGIQLAHNQALQAGGCTLFNHFYLAGSISNLQSTVQTWSLYEGIDEPFGTGNPTTDAANIATPENIPAIKCERGGAMNFWRSLVGASAPVKRIVPTRNGQIKATGFPRGLMRPTR